MGVDRDYRIRIITESDPSGAQGAGSALDDLGKKTKGAADANEEHSKSFLHAESSGRAFHRLLHGITEESPLAGLALRAMMDPMSAGIMAGVYAVQRLKEDIKQLEASLAVGEWESYAKITETIAAGLEKAALEAAAFHRELLATAKATESPSEAMTRMMSVVNAEIEAEEKLAKARQDAAAASKLEDEKDRLKVAAMEESLQTESQAGIRIEGDLAKARTKQKGLPTEETVNEKLRVEQGRLDQTRKDIDEKKKRVEEIENVPWVSRSTPQQAEMEHLKTEIIPGLESVESKQAAYVARLKKSHQTQIEAIQAANEEVRRLEGELKGTVDRIRKLQQDIPTAKKLAGISTGERALEASPMGQTLAQGADALHWSQLHGGQIDQGHLGAVQALTSMLTKLGVNNATMIKLIEQSAGQTDMLASRLQALEKAQAATNMRVKANAGSPL